jgi:hypothetical protein
MKQNEGILGEDDMRERVRVGGEESRLYEPVPKLIDYALKRMDGTGNTAYH